MTKTFTVTMSDEMSGGDCYTVQVSAPGKAGYQFDTERTAIPEDAIKELAKEMLEAPSDFL